MQDIEAQQQLDATIHAHREKQFDFGSISSARARDVLRKGLAALGGSTGYRISAASTVGGMTVSDCDKVLDAYFRENPETNAIRTRIECKLALVQAGILLKVAA